MEGRQKKKKKVKKESEEERAADELVLDRKGHKIKTYQLPLP